MEQQPHNQNESDQTVYTLQASRRWRMERTRERARSSMRRVLMGFDMARMAVLFAVMGERNGIAKDAKKQEAIKDLRRDGKYLGIIGRQ